MPSGYQNVSFLRLSNYADASQLGSLSVSNASVNFTDLNISIMANQTITLKVLADISGTATNGGTVYGVFGGSWEVDSANNGVTNNASGNIIAGSTMTVTADITPPIISELSATAGKNADGTNKFTVTWTTDKLSDSYLYYGLTPSYDNFNGNGNFVISHTLNTRFGVSSGSNIYHYKVTSTETAGKKTAVSGDNTVVIPDSAPATTTSAISKNNFASVLEALKSLGILLEQIQQLINR